MSVPKSSLTLNMLTHTQNTDMSTHIQKHTVRKSTCSYICVYVYSLITAQGLLRKFLGRKFRRYTWVLQRWGNHIFSHIWIEKILQCDTFLMHTLTHNVVYTCNVYLHVFGIKLCFYMTCLTCIVSGQAVYVCLCICVCLHVCVCQRISKCVWESICVWESQKLFKYDNEMKKVHSIS
jgi:hypothetical protein